MEHINGTFLVHNGKEQKKVKVSSKMVGHKFGEFSFTRTKPRGGCSTVEVPPGVAAARRHWPPGACGVRLHARMLHASIHYCLSGALGCAACLGGWVGGDGVVGDGSLGSFGATTDRRQAGWAPKAPNLRLSTPGDRHAKPDRKGGKGKKR